MMRYGYTIVYVADVAATITFYEQAFGLTRRILHEDKQYGELETGATTLAFCDHAFATTLFPGDYTPLQAEVPPTGIEIGLVTEDVAGAYAHALAAGATPLKAPEQKPWGQVVGYVRDLNGLLVELCSPMG